MVALKVTNGGIGVFPFALQLLPCLDSDSTGSDQECQQPQDGVQAVEVQWTQRGLQICAIPTSNASPMKTQTIMK